MKKNKSWSPVLLILVGCLNLFAPIIVSAQEEDATENSSNATRGTEDGEDETSSDSTLVKEEVSGDFNLTGTRQWRAPHFLKQKGALGWTPETFQVPKGLETNVNFWIDIYSKYTTDQGLLHDSEYIDLVYEILDFTGISTRTDLTNLQKEKMRSKHVKEAKKRTALLLSKLEKVTDPSSLSTEEKRIYDYFQKIDEKNKFKNAAKKLRLRFQLGQRDRLIQGVFFSGRYLEKFEQIFREAGLPIELTRLVFVESSFNVLARSKVGASGLWQIMGYTARKQLTMNSTIDKRNHPIEATKMATKLLRYNYNMLQDWPLAITGYNHGPAGVKRLTELHKSRELVDLGVEANGKKKKLGFASRNFYPSFLAILRVESQAPYYFGTLRWSQPLLSADFVLKKPVRWERIVKWFDGKDETAQIYNPHVTGLARKKNMPVTKGALISVPLARKDFVLKENQDDVELVASATDNVITNPRNYNNTIIDGK